MVVAVAEDYVFATDNGRHVQRRRSDVSKMELEIRRFDRGLGYGKLCIWLIVVCESRD